MARLRVDNKYRFLVTGSVAPWGKSFVKMHGQGPLVLRAIIHHPRFVKPGWTKAYCSAQTSTLKMLIVVLVCEARFDLVQPGWTKLQSSVQSCHGGMIARAMVNLV